MNHRLFEILTVLVLACSCSKDQSSFDYGEIKYCSDNLIPNCEVLIDSNISQTPSYILLNSITGRPSFNPKNSSEIVYIRNEADSTNNLLYRNLTSGEERLLARDVMYYPNWGPTGWILYNKSNNIYAITPDGNKRVQLTKEGINTFPDWSPCGEKIIYVSSLSPHPNHLRVMNGKGEKIDSLINVGVASNPSWSPDGKYLAYFSNDELRVYNIELKTYKTLYTNFGSAYIKWVGNSKLLWWSYGLYLTDISNSTTTILRESCENIRYDGADVSGDMQKIIVSTSNWSVEDNTYTLYKDVRIMDIDGSNERRVICE